MKWSFVLMLVASCSEQRVLSEPCTGDCTIHIHPPGIADPTSNDFHGREIARRNFDLALCASCHGADFAGGAAKVSCLGCHRDGPDTCKTCHGDGPTSNAHGVHANKAACRECHVVPARWDDDGHLFHDGIPITTARVTFGVLAQRTIDPADRKGSPTWDGTTCSNIYCHGDASHAAAGGNATRPRWNDPAPTGTCDHCHGNPPPSHIRNDCASCHPGGAAHINGVVEVGRTSGCDGCHGSAASPAPPTDLAGNMFTTALGVGAHQAHLQASSQISAPIPCTTCHLVPAALDSPGHVDTPAPAEVVASLGWDRSTETCASSGCHGTARPRWTSSGQVSCGTCHGIPPATASHSPTMPVTSCVTCHPRTVDAFGNIIVTGQTSTHINGVVDVN